MKVFEDISPQIALGLNARDLRTRAGLTQGALAERLGVARQTINNFECGRTDSYKVFKGYLKLAEEIGEEKRE